MVENKPTETVREFLDRREAELSDEIASLQGQLTPKEAELAEVRRAKGALGILVLRRVHAEAVLTASISKPASYSSRSQSTPDPSSWQSNSDQIAAQVAIDRHQRGAQAVTETSTTSGFAAMMSRYDNMTMKQLVLKALFQHFPDGATLRQLREFFRDGWGRDIERESLSPQMSRLKSERSIEQDELTKKWKLTTQGSLIAIGHWPPEARHKLPENPAPPKDASEIANEESAIIRWARENAWREGE